VKAWGDCTALVTGGRRGLGRAFAVELERLGCRVLVTSRRPEGEGQLRWDTDEPESTRALLAGLDGQVVDLVVHAAHATPPHTPIVALGAAALAASLSRNVVAAYDLLRGLARRMAREGFGRVLLVGSYAAVIGGVGQAAYIIEKAALEGMARAFSAELAPRGVLVNIVHPAIVDTEAVRERVRPEVLAAYRRRAPAGDLLSPADVVLPSLALLDPRHAGVTGQALAITGGVGSGAALLAPRASEEEP
jgi:NAD(P)-dependent dehydrogenase (short-subunit alcohol dehydrogenase family)